MNIVVSTEEGGSRGSSSSERHISVETGPLRGASSRFKLFQAKHRSHLRGLCCGEMNRMICCTTPTADQNKEDGNRFAPSAFKPLRRFGTMRWSTPIRLRRTTSGEPDASGAQLKRSPRNFTPRQHKKIWNTFTSITPIYSLKAAE
jgi:hypothetical protein